MRHGLSTVERWGCPRHGLVRNNELTMENGGTIAYPQPQGLRFMRGVARRVEHPGAPVDERTPEQVAADMAAGREWRRDALLCGGVAQLHGTELGDSSWLYIDPDGAVWRASTTLNASAAGTRTLTLQRFGVVGGDPLEYSYSYTQPDPQQSAPSLPSPGLILVDSTADGARALFMVYTGYAADSNAPCPICPVGWIEVQLAGAGAACVVTASTVVGRAAALGTLTSSVQPGDPPAVLALLEYDPPDGTPPGGSPPINDHVEMLFTDAGGAYTLNGRVIGMSYDASGVLVPVTVNVFETRSVTVTSNTIEFEPSSFGGELESTEVLTLTYQLHQGGQLVGSHSGTLSRVCSYLVSSVASTSNGPYARTGGGAEWDLTQTTTFGDGTSAVITAHNAAEWTGLPASIVLGHQSIARLFPTSADGIARVASQGAGYVSSYVGGAQNTLLRIAMPCVGVFGLAVDVTDYNMSSIAERALDDDCATPGGIQSAAPLAVTPTDLLYGSYCPSTGRLARDTQPICWT